MAPKTKRTTKEGSADGLRQRKPTKADSSAAVADDDITKDQPSSRTSKFLHSLFDPVDNSVLSLFRFGWGFIMFYECLTYLRSGGAKLEYYFLSSPFHFKYWGFDWVAAGPTDIMYFHFHFLSVVSVCFAFGLFYRLSAILFFVGFTYFYLIDMSLYLNHFYLVAVVSFMFIFLPANRDWSIDCLIWRSYRSTTMPRWVVYLIRALLLIVYFYAAVAKMNVDWLRGEPLRHWLAKRYYLPLIGPLLVHEWSAYFFSWGGLAVDLFAAPLFLFKRTRWLAMSATVSFHVLNKYIFSIGIFPAVMLLTSVIFYDSGWPRKLFHALSTGIWPNDADAEAAKPRRRGFTKKEVVVMVLLGVFVAYNIIMPLRYIMYPGDVAWTEWGHRWSWRMKLRDKNCDTQVFVHRFLGVSNGKMRYGEPEEVPAYKFINPKQVRKMSGRPELIHQFAYYVADAVNATGLPRPKVTARALCQLNFRTAADLIDPDVDLASEPLWEWPNNWQTLYPPDLTPDEQAQLPWNWNFSGAIKKLLGTETDEERLARIEREKKERAQHQQLVEWITKRRSDFD